MEESLIFFSYARADGEKFALRLAEDLRKAEVNVWIDQLSIAAGKRWDVEVGNALQAAGCILFIATDGSTTSTNVLDEVYYALDENKRVIPVIAASCSIPFRLKRLNSIDFTSHYETGLQHLLKALRNGNRTEAITSLTVSQKAKEQKAGTNEYSPTQKKNTRQQEAQEGRNEKGNDLTAKRSKFITPLMVGVSAVIVVAIIFLFIQSDSSKSRKSDMPATTNLTVFVHDEKGKADMILRQQGYVVLEVSGRKKRADINEDGAAYFQNLGIGELVRFDVVFSKPYRMINPDSIYAVPAHGKIYLPVALKERDATVLQNEAAGEKDVPLNPRIDNKPKHNKRTGRPSISEEQGVEGSEFIEEKMCTVTCDTKGVDGVEVSFADPKNNKRYRGISTASELEFTVPCYLQGTSINVTFRANGRTESRYVKLRDFEIPEMFKTN